MKQFLIRWICDEAEWWEFWKPRSGVSGGSIVGLLIGLAMWWLE
jgi:hypothetical protein